MSSPFAPLTADPSVTDTTPAVEPADAPAAELGLAGRALLAARADAVVQRDALDQLVVDLTNQLRALAGDAHVVTVDGVEVATYRPHTRQQLDRPALRRFLTDEQLAACHKTVTVRPFVVAKADR